MKTVNINRWDGGLAEDIRTFSTNQHEGCVNFDIISNPYLLRPFSDPVAETISTGSGVMTDFQITDVIACDIGGTTKLVGWGRESSASTKASFFTKDAPITSAWAKIATASGSVVPAKGTLIEYKGSSYALDTTVNLNKFTSGTTFTAVGTVGAPNTDGGICKPFVHPEDNIMYLATTYTIATYDGTTLTTNVLLLPSNLTITSMTNFGGYLAIACKPTSGSGSSKVYLWGRDTSSTLLQGIIDWGSGALEILENINETLVGVSAVKTVGTFDTITNYNYKVKIYSGGYPQEVKDFIVTNTNVLRPFKAKQNDKLYFGFDTDNAVHYCGKNKGGEWFVSKERFLSPTGSSITGTLNGISIVGDILFTAYTDGGVSGYLARTSDSTFSTSTATYLTTTNPKMVEGDRYEDKQLKAVQVSYRIGLIDSGVANGTVTLGVYADNRTLQPVLTQTKLINGNYIVTATDLADNTPLPSGREFTFYLTSLGDVRIKEIRYIYAVLPTL